MSPFASSSTRAKIKAAAFAVLDEFNASQSMYELVNDEIAKDNLETAITKTRKMAKIFLGDDAAVRLEEAMRKTLSRPA